MFVSYLGRLFYTNAADLFQLTSRGQTHETGTQNAMNYTHQRSVWAMMDNKTSSSSKLAK